MAQYQTQAVASRQPMDVAAAPGASTIDPQIIALTQAFLTASPEITLPQAVKAAYFFANTGQVEGRDSYIGTSGRVTGKVLEGYRGVARDAADRGVGEVQIKYRSLTNEEITWNDVVPGDQSIACEVYQLRAWQLAQRMGQSYEPIVGIGIVKPGEKIDSSGKPIPMIGGMTWGKKCKNRAYKDAMRHVPGGLVDAREVLEDAEDRGIHVELPEGAHLTRKQAIALVAESERLSISAPEPMDAQQAATTLAANNARMRGSIPEWQGFGDEDDQRRPAPIVTVEQPAAAAGNGTPASRPHWNSVDDAVLWSMDQGCFRAPQHAQNAYDKLKLQAMAGENPPCNARDMFDRWYADVLLRVLNASANRMTDAKLDGTEADEDLVTASDFAEAPQF